MDHRGHDNPLYDNNNPVYNNAGDYQYMALPHYGLAPFHQTSLMSPRSLQPLPAIPSNRVAPFHQQPVLPIYWQHELETNFAPQQQQQHQQLPPQQQVVAADADEYDENEVESYWCEIVFSCLVLWFCNVLFGLAAFVVAMVANKSAISDKEYSSRLGRISMGLSAFGIVVTLVALIIAVGVVFGLQSSSSNSTSSSSKTNTCTYTQRGQCYDHRSFSYQYNSCNQMGGYFGSDGYCYYN